MIRALCFLLAVLVLGACTQRMVCPAYQSAFIHDKEELRKKFSYFQYDSVPKVYASNKNKYLIGEEVPYRKKVRSMQTVAAKPVPVHVPDSISGKAKPDSVVAADLDKAARSVIDSTVIVEAPPADSAVSTESADSIYVITKDRELRLLKYDAPDTVEFDTLNNRYIVQKPKYYVKQVRYGEDQDTYMWYLRKSLVLPDVRLAKLQSGKGEGEEGAKGKGKKKKKGGLFKNLFGKKGTTAVDSAEVDVTPSENEFDFVDTTAVDDPNFVPDRQRDNNNLSEDTDNNDRSPAQVAPSRKRSKKKKKADDATLPKKDDKKKTNTDDDDGF